MNQIQRISKRFRIIFSIILWLIPLFTIGFWISGGFPHIPTVDAFLPSNYVPLVQLMPLWARLTACLLSFIPTTFVIIVMYLLIHLFTLYEQNKIFTEDNVRTIRNMGYAILVGEIVSLCYHPAITVFVSASSGITHAVAEIKFDIGDATTFMAAFVIILIAWIMRAGQQLQEESDYTV